MQNQVVTEIANKTWHINEAGMDSMYLLEGDSSSLLIDTGTGTFNLPALLQRYTSKPLTAALTHGHLDHAGGIGFFKEIWMHHDDKGAALSVTGQERREYVQTMMRIADGLYDVNPKDVVCFSNTPLIHYLHEHDVIHLGNRDIEVYETPGHTAGGLSFLDRKERLLFSGDACYHTILLGFGNTSPNRGNTISAVLQTAEKLEKLKPYYDRHYHGHVAEGAERNVLPLPRCLTSDLAFLCRGLLSGEIVGNVMPAEEFCDEHIEASYGAVRIQFNQEFLR